MRTKAIITGALAVLATAALTNNATNVAPRSVRANAVNLVVATAAIAKADRDELRVGTRSPAAQTGDEPSRTPEAAEKPDVAKPATAIIALTASCQQSINALNALQQADVTEDVAERPGPATTAAILWADRTEDMAEVQKWLNASVAARAACLPLPVGCEAAIASLQTVLLTMRTEELSELRVAIPTQDDWVADWSADWFSMRTAFSALATACGNRE